MIRRASAGRWLARAAALLAGYALAAVVGALAWRAGLPLPWVLGPLAVSAALSLLGVTVVAPNNLRRAGQLLIGAAAGLNVTGAVVVGLVDWLPVMIGTALVSVLASATLTPVFAYFARLDLKTAFFALLPGGLAEMGNIGHSVGAQPEPIALVHTFRVSLIVIIVPGLLVHWADLAPLALQPVLPPPLIALVLGCALAGAVATYLTGLNNPWMIGALVASAALSATGVVSGRLPYPIFAAGQVLLGYNIGSRFRRETLARLPQVAAVGTLMIVALAVAMGLFAWLLAGMTALDFPTAVLVSSPGGASEMTTTAQALHLSVALVAAFHVVRTLMVNGLATHFWKALDRIGYLQRIFRLLQSMLGSRT